MSQAANIEACRGCHCLAARKYARAVTRLYDGHLRPHGLRSTQFSVLAAVAIKGRAPVTSLARTLGLERTTLTRITALLRRDGLLREVESDDARQHVLELTPAGRRKFDRAVVAWRAAQDAAERQFPITARPRAVGASKESA